MMIINAHMHLGDCRFCDHDIDEQEVIDTMDLNGVDASIVFPLPGATDHREVHDRIAALAGSYPGRIFGLIDINPHTDEESYFQEVERCVQQYNFVGLKLHPMGHACPVSAQDADKVFAAARDFGIPLMVHSGLGAPYALPSMLIPRARQFPDLPIIVAHAGAYIFTGEAMLLAELCPNVYLETSWCATHRIKQMVEQFGAHRVMMGSDLPPNIATEIAKYRSCGINEDDLRQALAGTAVEVFKLPL